MPLVCFELRNEFGLGDPELYRAAPKDDPKAILDGVAVAGLVGILRQLGDLTELASDIFHDLHEQVMATSARGRNLFSRMHDIEVALPSLEKAIQGQRSHIHLSYEAGSDWHADLKLDQSHLLSSDLPRFMMDSYEECRDPPRLYLLDRFDTSGTGACLKRYSDPSYFKTTWAISELEKAEKSQREKKYQKIKRNESHIRNGVQFNASLSRRYGSTQLASLGTDEISSVEATPVPYIKLKDERPYSSTSFGSRTRLDYVEEVSNANSFVIADELEQTKLPKSQMNHSDSFPSDVHDGTDKICANNKPAHSSLQEKVSERSPSLTWDEKTEILNPPCAASCHELLANGSQYLPVSFEQSNAELELAMQGTLDQQESISRTANVPAITSNLNCREEISSETDNYMDALNTLDSETEIDPQRKTKCLNISCNGMESGTSQMQEEEDLESSYFAAAGTTGSHNSSTADECPSADNLIPSKSLEPSHLPKLSVFTLDSDCNMNNQNFEDDAFDIPGIRSSEGVKDDQLPESSVNSSQSVFGPQNTTSISKSLDSAPVCRPGVVSANFWTNGNLLGLEPSKPPDFYASNLSSKDKISDSSNAGCFNSTVLGVAGQLKINGFNSEQQKATSSNEIKLSGFSSTELMDGFPNASLYCRSSSPRALSLAEFKTSQDVSSTSVINNQKDGHIRETELHNTQNFELQRSESGQSTIDIASSISALAQKILTGSLQRKLSVADAPGKDMNATANNPHDASLLDKYKERPTGLVYEGHIAENSNKMRQISQKNSCSLSVNESGQSSPPLEHMKISFHPINCLDNSKLKLEYASGDMHERIDDLMFPSFQLLPKSSHLLQDIDFESDDTFCGSCPSTSEDHLSPRSDSNSEFWAQEDISSGMTHVNNSDKVSLSSSLSSFRGLGQTNQIDSEIQFDKLEAEDSILFFHSSDSVGLPGLDLFISRNNKEVCDSLPISSGHSASKPHNELQSTPPPPARWTSMRTTIIDKQKNSTVAKIVEHLNALQAEKFNGHKQQAEKIPRPPPLPETKTLPFKKSQKPNGQMEVNHVDNGINLGGKEEFLHQIRNKHGDEQSLKKPKECVGGGINSEQLDGREELLRQIKNKAFNLRPISAAKPGSVPQLNANISVAAILEKANAIRQACVGSDDGGDDDSSWSDG